MGDNKYVAYVGSYTVNDKYGIHVYDIDTAKGQLQERSKVEISNASNIVISNSGKYLYSIEDEGVAAFAIDENGDLTRMNQTWIGGMRACHMQIDAQDRYLFTAGFHDGRVTMIHLNEDGTIDKVTDGVFHQAIGKTAMEMRMDPRVTCTRLTPDEKFLCAVDWGLNQVKIYEVDYERGKLTLYDIIRCSFQTCPRSIRFSKDGKFAYLMEEQANVLIVFSYELVDGKPVFEVIKKISLNPSGDKLASSSGIKFSSDEKYLYVSQDGSNKVVTLKMLEDGTCEVESSMAISGDYPKTLTVLPGDTTVVTLNLDSDSIDTYLIDHERKCGYMVHPPISISKPNTIVLHKLG